MAEHISQSFLYHLINRVYNSDVNVYYEREKGDSNKRTNDLNERTREEYREKKKDDVDIVYRLFISAC